MPTFFLSVCEFVWFFLQCQHVSKDSQWNVACKHMYPSTCCYKVTEKHCLDANLQYHASWENVASVKDMQGMMGMISYWGGVVGCKCSVVISRFRTKTFSKSISDYYANILLLNFLRNRKTIGTSTIDDDGIKTMITNNLQSDPEYRSMIKVLLNWWNLFRNCERMYHR